MNNKTRTIIFALISFLFLFSIGFGVTKYLNENPIDFNTNDTKPKVDTNQILSLNPDVNRKVNNKGFIFEDIDTGFSNLSSNIYTIIERRDEYYIAEITKEERINLLHNIYPYEEIKNLKIYNKNFISYIYTDPEFLDQYLIIQTNETSSEIFLGSLADRVYTGYFYENESKQIYLTSKDRNDTFYIDILLPSESIQEYMNSISIDKDTNIIFVDNEKIYLNHESSCQSISLVSLDIEVEKCEYIKQNLNEVNITEVDDKVVLINTISGEANEILQLDGQGLEQISFNNNNVFLVLKSGLLEYTLFKCDLSLLQCSEDELQMPNLRVIKFTSNGRHYVVYDKNGIYKMLASATEDKESSFGSSTYDEWLEIDFGEYRLIDLVTN